MRQHGKLVALAVLLATVVGLPGCAALQQYAALREVTFSLDRVDRVELAGVRLDAIRSYDDLTVVDVARLGTALAREQMPLTFTLHIGASNPADNNVDARMVRFDWTMLIEDRETVSGVFDTPVIIPPGEPQTIPLGIELDLLDFFDDNLRDLAEMALSLSGQRNEPRNITVTATPTIDTALGAIRYPEPIRIVSREVG